MFNPPEPLPLKRLSVEDGLLLNAERWQAAHAYHRDRQNLHYQSLNQPGIVCGLGVFPIPAPENIVARYRDGRWIQISPGVAIDALGNPIIVPEPIEVHVASETREEPLLIYIVISYVDPEKLYRSESKYIIEETFRIDEKINPPDELEVELCRLLILAGTVQITAPTNVFFPLGNEIDLRYRQQAMARPQAVVRMGLILEDSPVDQMMASSLSGLIQSLPGLYPTLQGSEEIGKIQLQSREENEPLNYNLLYLSYEKLTNLTEAEEEKLKEYRQAGCVILIELKISQIEMGELMRIQQKLQKTLYNFVEEEEFNELRHQVQSELNATTAILEKQIALITSTVKNLGEKIGEVAVGESGAIARQHPLRNQPFLFGQFPVVDSHEIKLFNWGSLILVLGDLSDAWGLNEGVNFSRETIRSAQEMGINILNFSVKRQQLMQFKF